jgi:hypothetical protein
MTSLGRRFARPWRARGPRVPRYYDAYFADPFAVEDDYPRLSRNPARSGQ